MQPSTDRRRGGGPVWRPRSVPVPAADPDAPILPLATPASEARPPQRRPRRPDHGNNNNRRNPPPQENGNGTGRHPRARPAPQDRNTGGAARRRGQTTAAAARDPIAAARVMRGHDLRRLRLYPSTLPRLLGAMARFRGWYRRSRTSWRGARWSA
jgi:hypothetical protein